MNFDQDFEQFRKDDDLSEFQKLCRTIRHLIYFLVAPYVIVLVLVISYFLGGL